jgi:hypothetical protein
MALPSATQRAAGRTGDRRPARPGSRAEVRRAAAADGADLGAGLTDVSADGAGVRLTAPAAVGEPLDVGLVRPDGQPAARTRAAVLWCRPIGGGLYAAGLAFDRRLGLTELADLI